MKVSDTLLKIDKKISKIKFFSYLSYFGPLFILGGLYNSKHKDSSLKFHINQGFRLFLLEIFLVIVYFLLKSIPYVGLIISQLYYLVAVSVCIVCIFVGIFHVVVSSEQPLPYVGGKAKK